MTLISHRASTCWLLCGWGDDRLLIAPSEQVDVVQPVVEQPELMALERRLHAAACAIVAADDDVAHPQCFDGILQDGEAIEVDQHDLVGNIAMDEHASPGSMPVISLAGTRLSEQPIHSTRGACCLASLSKKPDYPSRYASPTPCCWRRVRQEALLVWNQACVDRPVSQPYWLRSVPIPSIAISTVVPAFMGSTPMKCRRR